MAIPKHQPHQKTTEWLTVFTYSCQEKRRHNKVLHTRSIFSQSLTASVSGSEVVGYTPVWYLLIPNSGLVVEMWCCCKLATVSARHMSSLVRVLFPRHNLGTPHKALEAVDFLTHNFSRYWPVLHGRGMSMGGLCLWVACRKSGESRGGWRMWSCSSSFLENFAFLFEQLVSESIFCLCGWIQIILCWHDVIVVKLCHQQLFGQKLVAVL